MFLACCRPSLLASSHAGPQRSDLELRSSPIPQARFPSFRTHTREPCGSLSPASHERAVDKSPVETIPGTIDNAHA
jgi:hypothetical protein